MTSKPAGNTPDQGADRSADRKPREVRGKLQERLNYVIDRVCDPDCEGRCKVCPREVLQQAAIALAAQDARIKELEGQKSFWENETWKVAAERDARDVCIKDLEKALHQNQGPLT